MKKLCIVCELWLVEPVASGGKVEYWCERCASQDQVSLVTLKPEKVEPWLGSTFGNQQNFKAANCRLPDEEGVSFCWNSPPSSSQNDPELLFE